MMLDVVVVVVEVQQVTHSTMVMRMRKWNNDNDYSVATSIVLTESGSFLIHRKQEASQEKRKIRPRQIKVKRRSSRIKINP